VSTSTSWINLKSFDISYCDLVVTYIHPEWVNLESLVLSVVGITYDVEIPSSYQKLQALYLTGSHNTPSYINSVNIPALSSLNSCLISRVSTSVVISSSLPNIQNISIGNCEFAEFEVHEWDSLYELVIEDTPITNDGISTIERLSGETEIILRNTNIDEFNFVQDMSNITSIDLQDNKVISFSPNLNMTNLYAFKIASDTVSELPIPQEWVNLEVLTIAVPQLESITIPETTTLLNRVTLKSCDSLQSFTFNNTSGGMDNLYYIEYNNSPASFNTDGFLASLDAASPTYASSVYLDIKNAANPPTGGDGNPNIVSLRSKGWVIDFTS